MLVYLFELDSVRNSDKEIIIGQQALFEEIVINGNQVVLSFNQLTDSKAFLNILKDNDSYEKIIELFKCGVLKVSQYKDIKTASHYVQNCIDKCLKDNTSPFLFSSLPDICKKDCSELLKEIKKSLVYGDVLILEEYKEKNIKSPAEKEQMDYICRYIRMILILGIERLAINPVNKKTKNSFMDYMNKIISICDNEDKELKETGILLTKIMNQISDSDKKSYRSNWINILRKLHENETTYKAEAMIDLCYNYTVEAGILNVAKHFSNEDEFKTDLLCRFNKYWNQIRERRNPVKSNDSEQIKTIKIFWDTAARIAEINSPDIIDNYELGYASQKKKWKHVRNKRMTKWFITALVYVFIFFCVERIMGVIEDNFIATMVDMRINAIISAVIDTLCFGLLGSWLSEKFGLVDVLESVKKIASGFKDIYRIHRAHKDIAYRRE